ncbi:MAG: geranylgeranylglyceryl/heptaprenylglyceryl phosphate synthase [Pyrodictiaceae archaeon]
MRIGKVEQSLRSRVESGEKLVLLLVDPEKPVDAGRIRKLLDEGADAVLVGGTLNVTPYDVDQTIQKLRDEGIDRPIIIFPGGVNNIGRLADAILFMVLMNSLDPYWLTGAQISAAFIIKRFKLEAIPTAYIVLGPGAAAGHVGKALPVPMEIPYIAAAYATAAELMGMRLVYLEAGSGSPQTVPKRIVEVVRKSIEYPLLVVGGGIRREDQAKEITKSGADAIVLGTIIERDEERAASIVRAIKRG